MQSIRELLQQEMEQARSRNSASLADLEELLGAGTYITAFSMLDSSLKDLFEKHNYVVAKPGLTAFLKENGYIKREDDDVILENELAAAIEREGYVVLKPNLREFLEENGYIEKDALHKLLEENGGFITLGAD